MNPIASGVLFAGGLFLGTLLMMMLGHYIRIRQTGKNIEARRPGFTAIEGGLYGLMGLILAFSFSGAATRFDSRRQLMVDEANHIGTAYLRLALLQPNDQKDLQEKFRKYTDARINTYHALPDLEKATDEYNKGLALQRDIWNSSVAATQRAASPLSVNIVLPALNQMIDIANSQYMASMMHPPIIIYGLLGLLVLICSLLAGYGMGEQKGRSVLHAISFAVLISVTVYTIIDIEYPRLGLIKSGAFDKALIDVRNSMGMDSTSISK
jgi:hypothetical protein